MSSQPSDHAAWGLPPDNRNNSNSNSNSNGNNPNPPNFPTVMNHPCGPPFPRPAASASTNPGQGQVQVPAPSSRKRQFRFSVLADIELLKLVVSLNPYGAAHGGRLHKWHAIADTLREGGIDIDFRRARDRTSLLLDQWREKDLTILRRSGSGNHEDQVQKEQLLSQIAVIEHAAKPRENVSDWRRVESSIRHRGQPPTATQSPMSVSDNPANQATLSVTPGAGPRPSGFSAFSAGLHPPSHLPPLVQKPGQLEYQQSRTDTEIQSNSLFAPHQSQHPEKLFKTNQGKVLSPRFSHFISGTPQTPPQPLPLHAQSSERVSPPRAEPVSYRNDLSHLRQPSRSNPNILGNPPLDGNATFAVPNSPPRTEGQNIQLNPQAPSLIGQGPQVDTAQLYDLFKALERRFDDEMRMTRKRLELEERRLEWEKEREDKRLNIEKARIEKEFEDRRAEREERRTREQRDKEERDNMLKLIIKAHEQPMSEGENPR